MPDWYDSPECEALTREFVDIIPKALFVLFVELGYEKLAVEMGRGIGKMFPGQPSKYDSINPVLAARLIKERIDAK